jgi:GrpB-like predicted nucleotidyltransferase (UPF0157 family)
MEIEIVAYNPDWAYAFETEKRTCLPFSDFLPLPWNIGSTAIPNRRAKPVIDIFIGVSPFMNLSFYLTLFPAGGVPLRPYGHDGQVSVCEIYRRGLDVQSSE